jgi:hypothetical protein
VKKKEAGNVPPMWKRTEFFFFFSFFSLRLGEKKKHCPVKKEGAFFSLGEKKIKLFFLIFFFANTWWKKKNCPSVLREKKRS